MIDNTKKPFAFFTVLTFMLVIQKPWWAKLLASGDRVSLDAKHVNFYIQLRFEIHTERKADANTDELSKSRAKNHFPRFTYHRTSHCID